MMMMMMYWLRSGMIARGGQQELFSRMLQVWSFFFRMMMLMVRIRIPALTFQF
jgi:hypothetical protein